MSVKPTLFKQLSYIVFFILLLLSIFYLFPWLFTQMIVWQKSTNQLMSSYLHQIKLHDMNAGIWLTIVSFLYGVFHALGPGHGKFVIASYLSTHQTKLNKSMTLTFLAALTQGSIAILATSIIVVGLSLSSAYFKLGQLWLERIAFGLLIILGINWCIQSGSLWWKNWIKAKRKPQIKKISHKLTALSVTSKQQSAVKNPSSFSPRYTVCSCGHQHLPTAQQLEQAQGLKSQCLIIFSIGLRPCTGAIFILFLSYMLDLYMWGIVATFAMSLGTGITLSCFALLVQYARRVAVNLGQWYVNPVNNLKYRGVGKFLAGLILIFLATSLIYGTTLPTSGGAVLFGR